MLNNIQQKGTPAKIEKRINFILKMPNSICFFMIAFLKIALFAGNIYDFCPVELHNTWKYEIKLHGPYTYSPKLQGTRQIEIIDTINMSASRLVVFSVLDSILDSVCHFQDTLIDAPYGLTYFCPDSSCSKNGPGGIFDMRITTLLRDRHYYSDSLLTKIYYKADSTYCLLQRESRQSPIFLIDTSISLKDIGYTYTRSYCENGGHSYQSTEITLLSFNNATIELSYVLKEISKVPANTYKIL
ncbi:MAG TPA: hypothetical protein VHO70_17060 [Chitinispirillaceae bacterium]|nr:hypothetical protein [Chitinispirillaceae bacterium]